MPRKTLTFLDTIFRRERHVMKRPRKKKTVILFGTVVFISIMVVIVAIVKIGPSFSNSQIKAEKKENVVEEKIVSSLMEESKESDLMLAGKVIANNTNKIKIDPDKGIVADVNVKQGDRVEKGQALFTYQTDQQMKTKEAELDVEAKSRAVDVAKSNSGIKWETYNKKVTQLDKVRADYEKAKTEELKGEVKTLEGEVDQAYTDALTGDNEIKNAESDLERAQLVQTNEQERLKTDTVTADNAGTIKSLNMDLISQSKEKQREEEFMEVIDDSNLFVKGEINEFDRDKVSLDQPVELIDRGDKENKWQGKIVQVANLSSDETGKEDKEEENPTLSKFPYKIFITKADKMPIIGSHVYVKVLPKSFETGKIIINKKYIISKEKKHYVWKISKNVISLHEVKITSVDDTFVTIDEGLSKTDKIAEPKSGMKAGMEVGEHVES